MNLDFTLLTKQEVEAAADIIRYAKGDNDERKSSKEIVVTFLLETFRGTDPTKVLADHSLATFTTVTTEDAHGGAPPMALKVRNEVAKTLLEIAAPEEREKAASLLRRLRENKWRKGEGGRYVSQVLQALMVALEWKTEVRVEQSLEATRKELKKVAEMNDEIEMTSLTPNQQAFRKLNKMFSRDSLAHLLNLGAAFMLAYSSFKILFPYVNNVINDVHMEREASLPQGEFFFAAQPRQYWSKSEGTNSVITQTSAAGAVSFEQARADTIASCANASEDDIKCQILTHPKYEPAARGIYSALKAAYALVMSHGYAFKFETGWYPHPTRMAYVAAARPVITSLDGTPPVASLIDPDTVAGPSGEAQAMFFNHFSLAERAVNRVVSMTPLAPTLVERVVGLAENVIALPLFMAAKIVQRFFVSSQKKKKQTVGQALFMDNLLLASIKTFVSGLTSTYMHWGEGTAPVAMLVARLGVLYATYRTLNTEHSTTDKKPEEAEAFKTLDDLFGHLLNETASLTGGGGGEEHVETLRQYLSDEQLAFVESQLRDIDAELAAEEKEEEGVTT